MSEFDRDRPSEMPMTEGEKELRRRDEENRCLEAELLKSMPIKIEETIGAKPGPAVQYLQYLTPGSVQYVVAVPSEEWERVKKTAGRAMAAEAEVESLRRDLEINAALLAKQTDLAREAEAREIEAKRLLGQAEAALDRAATAFSTEIELNLLPPQYHEEAGKLAGSLRELAITIRGSRRQGRGTDDGQQDSRR